jgi:glycine cleavage system regulatory protein
MRLFDTAQPLEGTQLRLPYVMRAALGWHAGAKLFCWSEQAREAGAALLHNQLSISTAIPNTRELWHLSARFRDRRGLVSELTSLLTDLRVDIVNLRASTQLHNTEFSVDADLDTSSYESEFDFTSDHRRRLPNTGVRELHARIVAIFASDLTFLPHGVPFLRITRNPILTGTIFAREFRFDLVLREDGVLELPRTALQSIRDYFDQNYPAAMIRSRGAKPMVLLVADIRWGVVDATVFYSNTGYKHVRIRASDRIGTLGSITSELHDRGFNILQLYTRSVPSSGTSITDVLVHLHDDRLSDDDELLKYLRETLRAPALKEYQMEVSFPRGRKRPS